MEFLASLASGDGFMPHGHCYRWLPSLVALHVVSDALTAMAYTSIPFTLFYFGRRRRDLPFNWITLSFAVFIVACGATHYLEIWTLWHPAYWVSGTVKAITALASVPTAILLVRIVPAILALPSPRALREAISRLHASESRFRAALEGSSDAWLILEAIRDDAGRVVDLRVVEVNELGARLAGIGGTRVAGLAWSDFFPASEVVSFIDTYRAILDGGAPLVEDVEQELPDGTLLWLHRRIVAVNDGLAFLSRDITERKLADDVRSRAAIVASSTDAIISKSPDGLIESWNDGATQLYGYRAEEVLGRHISMLSPPGDPYDYDQVFNRLVSGERVGLYEAVRLRKDGSLVDVSLALSLIRDGSGCVTGASAIARDITAAKQAERALKASLKEKEVLLKEVHHRVKNNLQIISSLLNLQLNRVSDPRARNLLLQSQRRMRSISMFHERVYQTTDLARVEMGEYLRNLVGYIQSTYQAAPNSITTHIDVERVFFGADAAIPCGLLCNELVSNAFKHAFPQGRGQIAVSFRRDPASGHVELCVSDDGVGLPRDVDLHLPKSLGLELVRTLAQQIAARVSIDPTPRGTFIRVRFPAMQEQPPRRSPTAERSISR